jgi:hypothetical protein
MKRFLFLLGISLILTTLSCQKEDDITTGELIAKELQAVIKENNIERVMNFSLDQSWGSTWVFGNFGMNYQFQGQFVFIEGEAYNLNNLIKYQIAEKNSRTERSNFFFYRFIEGM